MTRSRRPVGWTALVDRLVTTSADVSVSTNLGGWINRVGVYDPVSRPVYDAAPRLLRWQPGPTGRHIELGISEMNLFMMLGQLGLTAELLGEPLVPIGTVYDPFIARGLDALIFSLYNESRFILAATPSGVSLAPEGGAHQSTITPSIGIELPGLHAYEPAFAREVAWCLEEAHRGLHRRARRLLDVPAAHDAPDRPGARRAGPRAPRRGRLARPGRSPAAT